MLLVQLLFRFPSLLLLSTNELCPAGADSQVGGFVYILGPCGSLQQTLLCGWEFLMLPPQPPQVFSIRGFRLYFPTLELWVLQCVSLPSCYSQFICTQMWDNPLCQPPPCQVCLLLLCPKSSSPWLPVSPPPTGLDECFFFNSLLVGIPYSSIFWQFFLLSVFKFVLVFLLVVCRGTVYLPMPPS